MRLRFFLLLLIAVSLSIDGTRYSYAQTDSIIPLNYKKLTFAISATGVAYSATMTGLSHAWYSQQEKSNFHFFDDSQEWKQMDKIGHTYITFHQAMVFDELYRWCNLSSKKSIWYGAATAFTIQNSIEIFDGFSKKYGASISDVIANGIGAAGYILQARKGNKPTIIPKYSFYPSNIAPTRPNVLGNTWAEQAIKDYNGQTYWLAFNLKNIFFKQKKFPSWLALSIGYGGRNMKFATDPANEQIGLNTYRTYLFSLDLDLSNINTKSKVINYIFRRLNMIHLPAPAIEWNKNGINFHPIYF
ncbi:MAG: DUF2279 domain-containing protein [Cytophagales bacterium]|nr:MAG: DUF2279 domain-containing protein [Cytophagales bacterium]